MNHDQTRFKQILFSVSGSLCQTLNVLQNITSAWAAMTVLNDRRVSHHAFPWQSHKSVWKVEFVVPGRFSGIFDLIKMVCFKRRVKPDFWRRSFFSFGPSSVSSLKISPGCYGVSDFTNSLLIKHVKVYSNFMLDLEITNPLGLKRRLSTAGLRLTRRPTGPGPGSELQRWRQIHFRRKTKIKTEEKQDWSWTRSGGLPQKQTFPPSDELQGLEGHLKSDESLRFVWLCALCFETQNIWESPR